MTVEPLRRRATFVGSTEFDSLCQWKFAREIDRVGLPAHIHLPRIAPAFASAASFFFTAKGSANFRTARAGVDIGDATIAPDRTQELLGFAHVIRENRGSQSLRHTILDRNRFVELPIGQQIKQRPESFMTDNLEIGFRIRQAWRHVATAGILFTVKRS